MRKIKCEEFEKMLFEFLRGELDKETANAMKRHLLECERCRAVFERERKLEDILLNIPQENAPLREIRNRVFERIDKQQARFPKIAWKLVPATAVALSILLFLVFGRSQNIEAEEINLKTAIVSPVDNGVVLPDEVEFVVVAPENKRFKVTLIVDGQVVPLEKRTDGILSHKSEGLESGYHIVELIVKDSKTGIEIERQSVFYVFGGEEET